MGKFMRNASIGIKVSIAPAAAIVCLVIVAAVGWIANRVLSAKVQTIGGAGIARIVQADVLANQLAEVHQRVYQSLTWEAIGQRPEKIKELDDGLLKQIDSFDQRVKSASEEVSLTGEQRTMISGFAKGFANYAKLARDTLDIKSAGVASAASYVVTLDAEYRNNADLLRKFVQKEQESTGALVEAAGTLSVRNGWVIAGASVVGLALSATLAWVFVRAISSPLGQAAALAHEVAQGNLTLRPESAAQDATGRVLEALAEVSTNLNGMVVEIRRTAVEIDTASGEIASGNADLSSRTEATASALQQTAASIEELSETIRSSADCAREANALARDASSVALEGGIVVADVVSTMLAINAQAKKIGEIIAVIDGIAFQTNILALNAAVEAARAGEHGRGFNVVAGEVRGLAQRSADAAREIRQLIGSSVEQIESGSGKVHTAGQTMDRIVSAVGRVAQMVDDISRATSEQAGGIAQINKTVMDMDRSTQQNAAMVEQATAATESLRGQASRLVHMLTRFKTA
jgi:methyl-accepting chemotaxis protein